MEDKMQSAPKKQYICDPCANTSCNRQPCAMTGGPCFTTTNQEFAASGPNGLPEEATTRKVLEMKALIQASKKKAKPEAVPLRKFGTTSSFFDGLPATIKIIDPETTKIRKYMHDILWATLAGFIAGGALFVIAGMIIIGVLSYARG